MVEVPSTADWITEAPAKHPEICNLCGGKVIKTTNDKIYGQVYGNGQCFLCLGCRAYVGCHNNGNALGILTKGESKQMKMRAHHKFDSLWVDHTSRGKAYKLLASVLGIPVNLCHFGYFSDNLLQASLVVLEDEYWYENTEKAKKRLIEKYGTKKPTTANSRQK